ncbi:MAG: Ig-like domain-containing protein [Anaerolineae bacterium]
MQKNISLLILALTLFLVSCTPTTPPPPAPKQPTAEAQATTPENPSEAKAEATATLQPSTPAEGTQNAPSASPTPPPEPLPPMVLRTSPEAGQEQPLDAPIEITFDQPMDRDSVEKACAIEPGASVDGAFAWADDQTMRFTFKDGLKRGERYRLRVVGWPEPGRVGDAAPFELRFSAVGSLEVSNVRSKPDGTSEILADTIVTVLFNRWCH